MKFRRDLIIVALATFCLTSTLFMVVTSKSADSPNWNPWADINDDNNVDIYDAITLSNAFASSGNTSKNVNVTNPQGTMIETNLTIYADNYGYGNALTSNFSTEGYDRMFVTFAITQVGTNSYMDVRLDSAMWLWGVVGTTTIVTYSHPVENSTYVANVDPSSILPVSTYSTAEFAIQSTQCKLPFYMSSSVPYNSATIRVWVYLTVGTTSPPGVQKTEVTNWPTTQKDYNIMYISYNISSEGWSSPLVYCGGYSRISLLARVTNASLGPSKNITIFLTDDYWMSAPFGTNPTCEDRLGNTNIYNFTVLSDATGFYAYSTIAPPHITETKGPYYIAGFGPVSTIGLPAHWWVTFDICVYMRSE